MQLVCQHCNHELRPGDVCVVELEARCRHCGWAFGKARAAYRTQALPPKIDEVEDEAKVIELGPQIPQPAAVEVHRGGRVLAFKYGQHKTELALLSIAAAFAFFLLALLVSKGAPVLAGLAVAAIVVAVKAWRNKARVELIGGKLTIRHSAPHLPRSLDVASATQFYVDYEPGPIYTLFAQTVDGRMAVLRDIDDPVVALYIEQEIENYLEIEDREVPNSLPRARAVPQIGRPRR